MDTVSEKKNGVTDGLLIFLLVLLVLAQGFFSFLVVGDRGQPGWDFRPIPDIPGESPYAIYAPLPYPQHVRGDEGD